MRILCIEVDPSCARSPQLEEELEGKVLDALAGKRPPVLALPPGRRLAVVDIPDAPKAEAKPQPAPKVKEAPAKEKQ